LARLADEVARVEPAEVLLAEGEDELETALRAVATTAVTRRPPHEFGWDGAVQGLQRFFQVGTLDGFGIGELRLATAAAGALIFYLQATQLAALPHITRIERWQRADRMQLDRSTRQSLELVETLRDGTGVPLLAVIDRCCTPMGSRLLRDWVLSPLTGLPAILARQDAVAELHAKPELRAALREDLDAVLDLQRLTARIACGRANARDLLGLRQSLFPLPTMRGRLTGCASEHLAALAGLDPLAELGAAIAAAIADDPPPTLREGGLIRDGHDQELDQLRAIGRDSRSWLAAFQQREVERTGIDNLRVGFNSVFGYYIEVTHGNRHVELPREYVRKQTTKGAERYVTDELKAFESKALHSEELARDREYELFYRLRERAALQCPRLVETARAVAELDCLQGLATVAAERDFHRPLLDESRALQITSGRHPVLEATHAAGTFVPNDTDLDPPQRRLALITGPNMSGKSTYIRQNALIVLLAQIGSFVPARAAHLGIVDRIFTRVGAADDISRGASTFMVEMTETSNILNHATPRSLVILDEVGRGTSTYDGLALAWAIAEDLLARGCRTLFATHFHQLVDLAGPGRGAVNLRVAVREWGDEIVFLHQIEPGGTDRSYGLHVARLAGLPKPVLERAATILAELELEGEVVRDALQQAPAEQPAVQQKSLFESPRDRVLRELAALDADRLTPIEALQKLAEWARQVKGR
jgi:DNA mismatch repair protein MutS